MTMPITGPLTSTRASGLKGTVRPPGDKSISHRALMLGSLAVGETRISGLLEGEDVLNTAKAMRALGASIEPPDAKEDAKQDDERVWIVHGRGVGGLHEPEDTLDMGNSGTGARLLIGLLAAHDMRAVLTGDGSLRNRPMDRVTAPLSRMGASFETRNGGLMPLMVIGTGDPLPLVYESPVASAQVKSAILLAGLHARGSTTVIEPAATRDHTERMLRHFGAQVDSEAVSGRPGARSVTVKGLSDLTAADVIVPADPSSAAFLVVAALITDGSEITVENVGLNPLRTGLFQTLREMGADLVISNEREQAGEPVGDITARSSTLRGVTVPAERVPSMVDEYPILAVAAAAAEGRTRMEGLAELRVKETDRLAAMAQGLAAADVETAIEGDALVVDGASSTVPGGASIPVHLDHRIAMSFLVLGMIAESPITIDDGGAIATSYPNFVEQMTQLGADIKSSDRRDGP